MTTFDVAGFEPPVLWGGVALLLVNVLGAVAGFDIRRPAIKLPGLGRLGVAGPDGPGTTPAQPAERRA